MYAWLRYHIAARSFEVSSVPGNPCWICTNDVHVDLSFPGKVARYT